MSWLAEDYSRLEEMMADGHGKRACADAFGTTVAAVEHRAREISKRWKMPENRRLEFAELKAKCGREMVMQSLHRRLAYCYGDERAARIMAGEDAEANADLEAWGGA